MAEVLIREATDEDGEGLARLFSAVLDENEIGGGRTRDELARPASYFSERGGRLWLVLRDGEVVGSLGLAAAARPGEYELSLAFLDPSLRGRGFAAALLAGANAFAAASGGEKLSVWVDGRFEEGQRFCERHGFVLLPGTRAARDGSDALERCFQRKVTLSSPLVEARQADAG